MKTQARAGAWRDVGEGERGPTWVPRSGAKENPLVRSSYRPDASTG
jgi:hypothetical protein